MFFTSISQMMTESVDLTLVIRKANGQLTVSTLPKANGLKDEAANHIIPLTLTGTPEEMDAGFLQAMAQPVRKAMGLISNMVEFEKQTDIAAANSKAAKDAKSKESKEEKEKREKYDRLIKKAEEMITSRKHRDAINALQQARIYATTENQKSIDEKIAEQKKAFDGAELVRSGRRNNVAVGCTTLRQNYFGALNIAINGSSHIDSRHKLQGLAPYLVRDCIGI